MNLLDPVGMAVIAGYLVTLAAIAIASRRARLDNSMDDFYLGGRSLGTLVLFLTLYATQYSGLTLIGFAGAAYRSGFTFLVSITFGCSIIGGYLLLAPRLRALSERHHFITIGDYLQHRYRSRALTIGATLLFIFALGAYVLSNLKAAGYVLQAASGGRLPMAHGIIGLSLLIVLYESLGGLRAVAWTDVMQGTILALGCGLAFATIVDHYGFVSSMETLAHRRPDFFSLPSAGAQAGWLSTVVLVMFGVSIYPHAIQRIYAARSRRTLRLSLQLMLLMPFLTTLPMIAVGYIGAAYYPDLSRTESEQIVFHVLGELSRQTPHLRPLVVLLVCALIAAIMSTVDSALLAISALVTRDIYGRLRPELDSQTLTRSGKRFSWALMVALAGLSITLPQTLWRITELKLEVLIQLAPGIFLGLYLRQIQSRDVARGLVTGCALTGVLMLTAALGLLPDKPAGLHPGLLGALLNLTVILLSNRANGRAVRGTHR